MLQKNDSFKIIGADGKDYGALPSAGVSKEGDSVSYSYSAKTPTEVSISASKQIQPSADWSDSNWGHCVAGSGIGSGVIGGFGGSLFGPAGAIVGATGGLLGGIVQGAFSCG